MNLTIGAEVLKMRKRWMPYILFLVMVAGSAFIIWTAYAEYKDQELGEFANENVRTFAFPYSIATLLDSGQFWGSVLFVVILTSSCVATEYSWGTVRQAIVRGQGRADYLLTKMLGIALFCIVGLLTALLIGILFSLWATSAAGFGASVSVPGGGPTVPEVVLMVLRAALAMIPYGMLAFTLATVGRSTALGIAGTLGFMFGESIIVAIFDGFGGLWEDLADFSPARHASALVAENRIGTGDYVSIAARELADPGDAPNPNLAALVLILYSVGLYIGALSVVRQRDLPTQV